MAGRFSRHLAICPLAVALAASAAGCGSEGEPVSDDVVFGRSGGSALEGRFDVGGHRLYMECRGKGSPTVVYLHGSVKERGVDGHEHAARLPALLDDRRRVCVYDRADVWRSDSVRGPSTGKDSARDLHALLAVAPHPASLRAARRVAGL